MPNNGREPNTTRIKAFAPLSEPVFRRVWLASFFSNFGHLVLGVGAAWEMMRLTNSASMVALVQSALTLPLMLAALPAGAIADLFDRRKIALAGLSFSILSGCCLTFLGWSGSLSPWLLLTFCCLIGIGVAFYNPAWQSSFKEQVSPEHLPAAVALGSISFNIARSFGPALGGLIVLVFGPRTIFTINAAFYVPLWLSIFSWKRQPTASNEPGSAVGRAIWRGVSHGAQSPAIRAVVVRSLATGFCTASLVGLGPLVARDLLDGTPATYGMMLGAVGIGSVVGSFLISDLRQRLSSDTTLRMSAFLMAAVIVLVSVSRLLLLTCAGLVLFGVCSILTFAMFNVEVQLASPNWVTARALSFYATALNLGLASGAWVWGMVTEYSGVSTALLISAGGLVITGLLGILLPIRNATAPEAEGIPGLGSSP
jgi:predicted MFS family arabinose efflux permease